MIDYKNIVEYQMDFKEVRQNSIIACNVKMQAHGYPSTEVEYLRGQWYVPTGTKYATWLLIKYPKLIVKELVIDLVSIES